MTLRHDARFVCHACGNTALQWTGRCDGCGEWNTLEDTPTTARHRPVAPLVPVPEPASSSAGIVPGCSGVPRSLALADVSAGPATPRAVGVAEFDRVLGGGLTPGSSTLLSGPPGIGKSTLVLQAAAGLAAGGASVLYVSAEEAPAQLKGRAARIGALPPSLRVTPETDLDLLEALIVDDAPEVVIVDSIQTVFDAHLDSGCGSTAQVRVCAQRLADLARRDTVTVLLVGHVTKDGSIAGPRVLEHVVDTVVQFSGDRTHDLRFLRAAKHRYGSIDEVGVFTMTDSGLVGVDDAGGLFLRDRLSGVSGSVVVPLLEGIRPMLTEVQALVGAPADGATRAPVRSTQGSDRARLDLILAVLRRRVGLAVGEHDVFVSLAGGMRSTEPGLDLGVAVAVASAVTDLPVPDDLVVVGEIGLGGELRGVRGIERRLTESARLGFTRAVVPASTPVGPFDETLDVQRVAGLAEAVQFALAPASHGGQHHPSGHASQTRRSPYARPGPQASRDHVSAGETVPAGAVVRALDFGRASPAKRRSQ